MKYSTKQKLKNRMELLGIFLTLLVISVFSFSFALERIDKWAIVLAEVFLFFLGAFTYPIYKKAQRKIDAIEDRLLKEIDNYNKGDDGEKRIFSELDRVLDLSKYHYYKNYVIPGKDFDIDTVIIGPKGIIILEIKNYKYPLHFTENGIFLENNNDLIFFPSYKDPSNQAERHAKVFKKHLISGGFYPEKIYKAVAFPERYSVRIQRGVKTGAFMISGVEELKEYISGLPNDERFTEEFCSKINNFLMKK